MFKNKKYQIIVGVVLVLILVFGGYFIIAKNSSSPSQANQQQDQTVQKLTPEDIGLSLTVSADKKKVKFSISKPAGIASIEYQLTYEADSTAEEIAQGGDSRVQRGITGDAKLNSGDSGYDSKFLDLGSCSKNVCRYDAGIKSVSLTLKVAKNDGKTYEVQKTLSL